MWSHVAPRRAFSCHSSRTIANCDSSRNAACTKRRSTELLKSPQHIDLLLFFLHVLSPPCVMPMTHDMFSDRFSGSTYSRLCWSVAGAMNNLGVTNGPAAAQRESLRPSRVEVCLYKVTKELWCKYKQIHLKTSPSPLLHNVSHCSYFNLYFIVFS